MDTAISTKDVRLDRLTLHILSAGSGPLAICLHGITANAYVFEPLMMALAHRFHVVSIDMRGHGRSEKPATGYSADDYADDIEALTTHFADGPALLIGHALGARDALVAGARNNGLVAGVVAIDFTPFIEPGVFASLEQRIAGGDRLFAGGRALRAALQERYPLLPDDAIERRAAHGYTAEGAALRPLADRSAMRETAAGLHRDIAPVLASIAVPTLLIRGAASRFVSEDAWRRSQALRPDITTIEIPGADHYAAEEAPGPIAEAIIDFWRQSVAGPKTRTR